MDGESAESVFFFTKGAAAMTYVRVLVMGGP